MFTTDMKENGQMEISINGVAGDILQQLIEYCYSGEIAIDSVNVEKIAKAATMLQFTAVEADCCEFYTPMLTAPNCLGIRRLADQHNMLQLKENAHTFVLDHFVEVSQWDEFHHLSADQLTALLKDDKINVATEEDVFNALMVWIKFDVDVRKKSLKTLLECVRFQHVKDSVSDK